MNKSKVFKGMKPWLKEPLEELAVKGSGCQALGFAWGPTQGEELLRAEGREVAIA